MKPISHVRLVLDIKQLPIFFQLLRKGIFVDVGQGVNAKALLCEQLKIRADYIERKVQTIFLNGKPVDDLGSIRVQGGSTLALSAAMPGVAGAMLRSGGYYAPLRRAITFIRQNASDRNLSQTATVKCFNTVASDLGPLLLEQGVWIAAENFQEFIHRRIDDFLTGLKTLVLDGESVEPERLKQIQCSREKIFLKVEADSNSYSSFSPRILCNERTIKG